MSLSEYVKKEDLIRLFHLPMKEASKKLGVSESSLRNICRKHEIGRWPYRKFQQLDAHINSLRGVEDANVASDALISLRGVSTPDDFVRTKEMINALITARHILEENPNMSLESVILMANQQTNVSSQTAAVINSSILSQVSSCDSPRVDPQEYPSSSPSQRPVIVPKLFIPSQPQTQPMVSPASSQPVIPQQSQQQVNLHQFRVDFVNFSNMFSAENNRQKQNHNLFEGSFAGGGSMSASSTPSTTPRNFEQTPSTPKMAPSDFYNPQQPSSNSYSAPSLIHPFPTNNPTGYTTSGNYGGINSNNTTPRGPTTNTKDAMTTQPLTPKESAFQPYHYSPYNSARKMDTPRPEPYPTNYTRNKGSYNLMDLHSQSLQRSASANHQGFTSLASQYSPISRYNSLPPNFQAPPSSTTSFVKNSVVEQQGLVLPPITKLEEFHSLAPNSKLQQEFSSTPHSPHFSHLQGPPLTSFLSSQPPLQQQQQQQYYQPYRQQHQVHSMEE